MSAIDLQRIKTQSGEVVSGRHCLAELAELLATDGFLDVKLFILVDENTLGSCLPTLIGKASILKSAEVIEVAAGEDSKQIDVCTQLWGVLGELGADRSSVIINLGGGVVTDLGGFIAGTFKRGIRYFNVPTSLLAQVDASVGSKVGINFDGLKNEVGLFNPPEKVFIDPSFLESLPRIELLSGFAEMIKHGLICDEVYWQSLKDISFYNLDTIDAAIWHSVKLKNELVTSDPFESGRRKLLNFGHTIGHAMESISFEGDGKSLLHGEAVAFGMVCESFISHKNGLLKKDELLAISSFIFSHYAKVEVDEIKYHRILELISHDKKNKNGVINMTLLDGIGNAVYDQEVGADKIIDALNYYRRWVN